MATFELTDPTAVNLVTIVVTQDSSAFIGEMTFSHWILGDGGKSPAEVADDIETPLAALLGATTSDGLRAVISNDADIVRTVVSQPLVDPQPLPDETTRALSGGNSGSCPPDLALVVSFRSDTSGPAFRGRTYVPALGTSMIDSSTGLWNSATAAGLATDWNAYIAALDLLVPAYNQIVVSRFHVVGGATVPRSTPLGAFVQVAAVDVHADTQRRRGTR